MAKKIYKRDLIKLLLEKEEEATHKQFEIYHKQKCKRRLEILEEKEYLSEIYQLQRMINDILMKSTNLALDMKEDKTINYNPGGYYSLEYNLNKLKGKDALIDHMISNCNFDDPILDKLQLDYNNEVVAINVNYLAIIDQIRLTKNINKSVEYVKSLGFDLSSIEKETEEAQTTAVAPIIDVTKLYI